MNLIVSIVNLLFLLKEPKTQAEIYHSNVFTWEELQKTIDFCKRARFIVKDYEETSGWLTITSLGMVFLKCYDNEKHPWHIRRYNVSKQPKTIEEIV